MDILNCIPGSVPMDKENITLAEISPLTPIRLCPAGATPLWTTPRELLRAGRFPAFLTVAEIEFALSPCDSNAAAATDNARDH